MTESGPESTGRIYLDNAATSWPKQQSVLDAVCDYTKHCGAAAGRGGYASAVVADQWVSRCRTGVAKLLSAPDGARSISICHSGTHALNCALHGLLRRGNTVLASEIEHNSVLRPLTVLGQQGDVDQHIIPCDTEGTVSLESARELCNQHQVDWIAINHASNVTGRVQDLPAWSALANEFGARLLVDASQTVGYTDIDLQSCKVDALASAGHKGLGALTGTGFLYLNQQHQDSLLPLMQGGTGKQSELLTPTLSWPQSVEVGNLNMPGVVSMAAASEHLLSSSNWQSSWQAPFAKLVEGLAELRAVHFVGLDGSNYQLHLRIPVLSLIVDDWDAHDFANVLDSSFQIEVRSGLHCAPLVHQAVGAPPQGTIRLSTGHHTSEDQVDRVIAAFREILG